MIGKPKYNINDRVKFKLYDEIIKGYVYIIDPYGTFDYTEDVSYDIMSVEKNCLYKHIPEKELMDD